MGLCKLAKAKIMPAPITPLAIDRVYIPVFHTGQESSGAVGSIRLFSARIRLPKEQLITVPILHSSKTEMSLDHVVLLN